MHASKSRTIWIAALGLAALVGAAGIGWFLRPTSVAPETRLEFNTLPTTDVSLAISPDGLKVVFVGGSGAKSQLWLRSLDSSAPRILPGTTGGSRPFWSPDSRSIGFFADVSLKRVDIDGGSAQTLASALAVPIGGTWNRDGTILFADNPGGPIRRTSARGGEPAEVTRVLTPEQRGHFFPEFLPDGQHFLFYVSGNAEARGVYVGQLDGPDNTRLFDTDGPATYASTGHLLFVRQNKLLAQRFDAARRTVAGDPFVVDEPFSARATVSASAAGPIAYRTHSGSNQRQFVRLDRSGREIERVVYPDSAALSPALSHDGSRMAVFRFANGNMDLWSYETKRGTWARMTVDPGDDIYPLWSPDDRSIVFASARNGGRLSLYKKLVNAPLGAEELLLSTPEGLFPMDWSPDSSLVLYNTTSPKRGADIWALPLVGDRRPFEVVATEFNESQAQFSSDGKFIAYQSNRTGRDEIYLRPFPGPGADVQVSSEGGSQARWHPEGKELFYVGGDDRLMAVPIRLASDGKSVEPGTPSGLFATSIGSTVLLKYRQQYVVARDGLSFVMNSAVEEGSASPVTVLLNWKPPR